MKTAAITTSIDAFHAHRATGKAAAQRALIIEFIAARGGDWSIGEIAHAMGMEKSTVSPRIWEALNITDELEAAPRRKDRRSGIEVRPVKLPAKQVSFLF